MSELKGLSLDRLAADNRDDFVAETESELVRLLLNLLCKLASRCQDEAIGTQMAIGVGKRRQLCYEMELQIFAHVGYKPKQVNKLLLSMPLDLLSKNFYIYFGQISPKKMKRGTESNNALS